MMSLEEMLVAVSRHAREQQRTWTQRADAQKVRFFERIATELEAERAELRFPPVPVEPVTECNS